MPALATNQARVMDVADRTAILRDEIVPNPLTIEAVRSQNP